MIRRVAVAEPRGAVVPARPLRLTERGRLLAAVLAATAVVTLVLLGHASAAAPQPPASRQSTVVVQPGESLWDVATRVRPQEDPRAAVADLQRSNDLPTSVVHPGERLLLPPAA